MSVVHKRFQKVFRAGAISLDSKAALGVRKCAACGFWLHKAPKLDGICCRLVPHFGAAILEVHRRDIKPTVYIAIKLYIAKVLETCLCPPLRGRGHGGGRVL